jgi:hypothetical protein
MFRSAAEKHQPSPLLLLPASRWPEIAEMIRIAHDIGAVPEMTNDLVIQEFRRLRCNNLVVASNTFDAKQGHRASLFHRGQHAYIGSLNAEGLPRGHGSYVTAS